MQGLWKVFRGAALCLTLTALAGCDNELPTANGAGLFPNGVDPTTLELTLSAGQFLLADTIYDGYTGVNDAPYLLLANQFEGGLDAHALVHFTGFPDSVYYVAGGAAHTDTSFSYVGGRVRAVVDSLSTSPHAAINLQLWELDQAWDSATVSWQTADSSAGSPIAWHTPGGALGTMIAETNWLPGDSAQSDTVTWTVDSLAVNRMTASDFAGLAVVSGTADSRMQLSGLMLQADIRPVSDADTVLTRDVVIGPQTFIFSPTPPRDSSAYRTGGLTGQRTVLRLRSDLQVPSCADPTTTACPMISLRDVVLNKATLVLDPTPVPFGFGPVGLQQLTLRRVLQPELGRRAPLGAVVAVDTVGASAFLDPGGRTIGIDLSSTILSRAPSDTSDIVVVLMAEGATPEFGSLWFTGTPRLRLLYTLPLTPTLP